VSKIILEFVQQKVLMENLQNSELHILSWKFQNPSSNPLHFLYTLQVFTIVNLYKNI